MGGGRGKTRERLTLIGYSGALGRGRDKNVNNVRFVWV